MNTQAAATAYGLLWLVMGNSDDDQNVRLAYSARAHIKQVLTPDEMKAGITRAKELAKQMNVHLEGWM